MKVYVYQGAVHYLSRRQRLLLWFGICPFDRDRVFDYYGHGRTLKCHGCTRTYAPHVSILVKYISTPESEKRMEDFLNTTDDAYDRATGK